MESHSLAALASTLLLSLAAGCSSVVPPSEVRSAVDRALTLAKDRHATGDDAVARHLLSAVEAVDSDAAGLAELKQAVAPGAAQGIFDHPYLGSNVAPREPADRSVLAAILLYLPDRLLDLCDVLSFDVHVGPGLFVNLHLTRAVQLGAGGRGVAGLGWHDHRSLGVLTMTESELVLPGFGTNAFAGMAAGTSGVQLVSAAQGGLHRPSNALYQEYRDYWAAGVAVTAVLVGIDFDLHPVELADFLVGFSTVDFLRDDFAATRGLDLSESESDAILRLAAIRRSQETLDAYQKAKAVGGSGAP